MKTYIVCKRDTENKNPKAFKTKNGRIILKSTCLECNNKKVDLLVKIKDLDYYLILELEHL